MKRKLSQTEVDFVVKKLKPLLKQNQIERARQVVTTYGYAEYGNESTHKVIDWLYSILGPDMYFKDSTEIYPFEFQEYPSSSFVIPSGITGISNYAFIDSWITIITIPSTVERIGKEAFAFSSLKKITFEDISNVSIADDAFMDSDLDTIYVKGSVSEDEVKRYYDMFEGDVKIVQQETGKILRA